MKHTDSQSVCFIHIVFNLNVFFNLFNFLVRKITIDNYKTFKYI